MVGRRLVGQTFILVCLGSANGGVPAPRAGPNLLPHKSSLLGGREYPPALTTSGRRECRKICPTQTSGEISTPAPRLRAQLVESGKMTRSSRAISNRAGGSTRSSSPSRTPPAPHARATARLQALDRTLNVKNRRTCRQISCMYCILSLRYQEVSCSRRATGVRDKTHARASSWTEFRAAP